VQLRHSWLVFSVLALVACDDGTSPPEDAGADDAGENMEDGGRDAGGDAGPPPPCNGPPGLYEGDICDDDHLAEGVRHFRPEYELWSDDADKDRYILLPAGSVIDTTDPDNWIFPVGTIVWKTFSHDGVRLETRILQKVEAGVGVDDAWRVEAWAWNAAQTSVTEVSTLDASFRENVLGTDHDIPSQDDCLTCHRNGSFAPNEFDTLNGFSAIQLNHPPDGVGDEWTLQSLLDAARLSTAMPAADPPSWITASRIPGDEVASEALGYLHANCGHCHREGAIAGSTTLRTWIDLGAATVEETPIFTAIGQPSFAAGEPACEIHPQGAMADTSVVLIRMMSRSRTDTPTQMPPLGTEFIDEDGIAAVRAWMQTLDVDPFSGDCLGTE
jgi:mono/diheme cytochrome c family protein